MPFKDEKKRKAYMKKYMRNYRKRRKLVDKKQLEQLGNILSQLDIELPPDLMTLFFGSEQQKRGGKRRKK